jgi:c-di-GMP-binding flagellar brake protein YcgR
VIKELKEGMRIDINTLDSNTVYLSRVEQITSANTILINSPLKGHLELNLRTAQRFYAVFYAGTSLIKFKGTFLSYEKEGGMRFASVRLSDGERIQQRKYYRLEKIVPVEFEEKIEEEDPEFEGVINYVGEKRTGMLIDISGGGLRFKSNHTFASNTEMIFHMHLKGENEETTPVVGKIVDHYTAGEGDYLEVYRVQFNELDKNQIELVSKYIWEEQQKKRRQQNYETELRRLSK